MAERIPRKAAFTLIELLVVIAIIGVLMAMLLAAVQRVRESANRLRCATQMREVAIALHNYHESHGSFPGGSNTIDVPSTTNLGSWAVVALTYLEENSLGKTWYERYVDYYDPILATPVNIFRCPSETAPVVIDQFGGYQYSRGNYAANHGTDLLSNENPAGIIYDGVFGNYAGVPTRITDILDGTSHTLMLGELRRIDPQWNAHYLTQFDDSYRSDKVSGKWSQYCLRSSAVPLNYQVPASIASLPQYSPLWYYYLNEMTSAYGSNHLSGANFAFADGSVRFVQDRIALITLQDVSTKADGEDPPAF